jgi:hypothetical protein
MREPSSGEALAVAHFARAGSTNPIHVHPVLAHLSELSILCDQSMLKNSSATTARESAQRLEREYLHALPTRYG